MNESPHGSRSWQGFLYTNYLHIPASWIHLDWTVAIFIFDGVTQQTSNFEYTFLCIKKWKSSNLFLLFISSILKSLVILAIWLALSSAIYSQIALFFALNHIFYSANENETVKQNNQSDFKNVLTNQSHCRKMKDEKAIVW